MDKDSIWWTPHQIVESGKYPFSMGQLRHLLLYRHKNGLDSVIRKIGKRIVFRIDLFNLWIDGKTKKEDITDFSHQVKKEIDAHTQIKIKICAQEIAKKIVEIVNSLGTQESQLHS